MHHHFPAAGTMRLKPPIFRTDNVRAFKTTRAGVMKIASVWAAPVTLAMAAAGPRDSLPDPDRAAPHPANPPVSLDAGWNYTGQHDVNFMIWDGFDASLA